MPNTRPNMNLGVTAPQTLGPYTRVLSLSLCLFFARSMYYSCNAKSSQVKGAGRRAVTGTPSEKAEQLCSAIPVPAAPLSRGSAGTSAFAEQDLEGPWNLAGKRNKSKSNDCLAIILERESLHLPTQRIRIGARNSETVMTGMTMLGTGASTCCGSSTCHAVLTTL